MNRDPSPLDVAVDTLAVYRIVRLLQRDEVWPIRETRDLYLDVAGGSRWADLADCPWCLSMWVAAAVAFARARWPRAWGVVARILAGSAVAGHLAHLEDL